MDCRRDKMSFFFFFHLLTFFWNPSTPFSAKVFIFYFYFFRTNVLAPLLKYIYPFTMPTEKGNIFYWNCFYAFGFAYISFFCNICFQALSQTPMNVYNGYEHHVNKLKTYAQKCSRTTQFFRLFLFHSYLIHSIHF